VHTTDRYTSRPDVRMVTWPSQPLRTDVGMIDMASGHLGGRYVRMRTWPSGPPGPRYVRMGNLTFVRIIRGPTAAHPAIDTAAAARELLATATGGIADMSRSPFATARSAISFYYSNFATGWYIWKTVFNCIYTLQLYERNHLVIEGSHMSRVPRNM
jgi:hypothetical protein